MHQAFLQHFMEREAFPQSSQQALIRCAARLCESGQETPLDCAAEAFAQRGYADTVPQVESIAAASGVHAYTVWLLLLIEAAFPILKSRQSDGPAAEALFWDTFADLRCKAVECRNVYGIWGTFVASWYPIFYVDRIVKLGRLEFERRSFPEAQAYAGHGLVIQPGDPIVAIHIPSSGEPFGSAARLDACRRAYDYFARTRHGGPLVCICASWLLYPEYRDILPEGSNILDFTKDFELLRSVREEAFDDAWRVFGADFQRPASEWPENTSLQRAFKRHVCSGGKAGYGVGLLIFDGERILTRQAFTPISNQIKPLGNSPSDNASRL